MKHDFVYYEFDSGFSKELLHSYMLTKIEQLDYFIDGIVWNRWTNEIYIEDILYDATPITFFQGSGTYL